ncbi:MAG: hypothetical protein R6U50_18675, partial [Desulfobacterales bacterium]
MKKLRNIFDKYDQDENNLTHALLIVFNHNEQLLKKILNKLNIGVSGKHLKILTQTAPFRPKEKNSVIDGYIYSEEFETCIGIETKIFPNSLERDQLKGHINQIKEYQNSYLLILTPDETEPDIIKQLPHPENVTIIFISWISLLELMGELGPDINNPVGKHLFNEFMDFIERKYHMTPFTGINFRNGYDLDLAIHYTKKLSEILTP